MKHLDAAFVDAVFEIGSWIIKFGKNIWLKFTVVIRQYILRFEALI